MVHKRVTSRDVAQRAGVSRTTVSFVVNDVTSMKISEQTRQRVLQAAEELGYIPDAAARTLASGKTCTVGLIVSHAKLIRVDVFIPQLLHSLYDVCREYGYRLLLETAEYAHLRTLIETGYPLVLIGKYPHSAAHAVMPETNPEATYHTTAHLIGLGHQRIAFIHFMPIDDATTDSRLLGYRRALAEVGIPFDVRLVRDGDYCAASGFAAMTSLLAASPRPTALVAGNDTIAIGAMAAIREAGLRIPDDVAVTGHDDIPTARYTVPSLTTVRMPAQAMGRRCGEMTIQLMAGKQPAVRQVAFPTELVIRNSCGAKPITEPLAGEAATPGAQ